MRRFWNKALKLAIAPAFLVIVALVFAAPAQASSSQGELIPSFGTGGVASQVNNVGGLGLVRQTDGKLIEGGLQGGSVLSLTRFTASGNVDTTYAGGTARLTITGFGAAQFGGIAIQPDNKVTIFGSIQDSAHANQMDFVVARYTTAGVLDTSFGSGNGYVIITQLSTAETAGGIAISTSGNIFLAGSRNVPSQDDETIVCELSSSGSLVSSFGTGGIAAFDLNPTINDTMHSVLVQPNGSVVIVGTDATQLLVARLTSSGALDAAFNASGSIPGLRAIMVLSQTNVGLSVIRDTLGRYVIAGKGSSGTGNNAFVLRLLSDGSTDASFAATSGHAGWAGLTILTTGTEGHSVIQDYQGRYVLAGNYVAGFPVDGGFVARFTASGDIDSTFAAQGSSPGYFSYHPVSTDSYYMNAVVLAPNGNLYAGGFTYPQTGSLISTIWAFTGEAPPPAPLPDTGINLAWLTLAASLFLLAGALTLAGVRLRRRSVR